MPYKVSIFYVSALGSSQSQLEYSSKNKGLLAMFEKYKCCLVVLPFLFGCIQNGDVGKQESTPPIKSFDNKNAPKKVFKSKRSIIHNFTVTKPVKISDKIIEDPSVDKVIIENAKGSFRMVIEHDDLKHHKTVHVPLSELEEIITPQVIYKR